MTLKYDYFSIFAVILNSSEHFTAIMLQNKPNEYIGLSAPREAGEVPRDAQAKAVPGPLNLCLLLHVQYSGGGAAD